MFCSFLALVIRKELRDRLDATGEKLEWADAVWDLDAMEEVEVEQEDKRYCFAPKPVARGTCSTVFRAAGVALPPTGRQVAA